MAIWSQLWRSAVLILDVLIWSTKRKDLSADCRSMNQWPFGSYWNIGFLQRGTQEMQGLPGLVMTNIANWKITMLLMGKSTINDHFNSKLLVYQRVCYKLLHRKKYLRMSVPSRRLKHMHFPCSFFLSRPQELKHSKFTTSLGRYLNVFKKTRYSANTSYLMIQHPSWMPSWDRQLPLPSFILVYIRWS